MAERESKHLSKSILLEESGNPAIVRMIILFSVVMLGALVVWSFKAPLDEVANAPGEISTIGKDVSVQYLGQVQEVQHLEGGIVSEIRVFNGRRVGKGDVVMVLDSVEYRSELEKKRKHLKVLEDDRDRLGRFVTHLVEREAPDCSAPDVGSAERPSTQILLFQQMIASMDATYCVLQSQIRQRKADVAKQANKEASLRAKIKLVKTLVSKRDKLQREGLVSEVKLLENKIQLVEAQGQLKEIAGDRRRIEGEIAEIRSKTSEIVAEERRNIVSQLKEVEDELSQVKEDVLRLEEKIHRAEIRSPVDGIVDALVIDTVGGVVEPGKTIMEILPRDADLVAEVRISQRDIGHVNTGDEALLRIDTYDFGRYGGIRGKLTDISATTFFDEQRNPYYKGLVTLERNYVGEDPAQNPVLPGMTIQADIRTGKKTVMEYLLKPLYASARQALQER